MEKSPYGAGFEEIWRTYMMTGRPPEEMRAPWFRSKRLRPLIRRLPASPRCRMCYYPFQGAGGSLARHLLGIAPSRLNPQLCNQCEALAQEHPGGAEIETTLLFADIRGSTALAENMSPAEFSRLINRFYETTSRVLFDANALIEKLIGDEVTGFFVPGFAGPNHARVAIRAAQDILDVTRSWVPVGVGVHWGSAFIGSVRSDGGVADIVVLGDPANVAARLASQAGPGEVLVSEAARLAAGLPPDGLEPRRLQLKGRTEPVDAWVIRPPAAQAA
jgi:adenylate cyclase